jgi:LTXXQ motif family protein
MNIKSLVALAMLAAVPGMAGAATPSAAPGPAILPSAGSLPASLSPVEQQIAALQTELRITQDQLPQWLVFSQAMRDAAHAADDLFQQRATTATTMTAQENMHSYAQVTRAYADTMAGLSKAFDTLYAILSEPQRQSIDVVFRQQTTPGRRIH